jgi:hypothetical protein
MAAKFRKVDPRFWCDEKVRMLDSDGRLLALWLLTSSRVNRCGIVLWSPGLASEETGIPRNRVDTVLDTVCGTLPWKFDQGIGVVFLVHWWRYNRPDNSKALKGALADLHDVPRSKVIEFLIQSKKDLPSTMWECIDTVCDTVLYTVSAQEKEQEKEQEQDSGEGDVGVSPLQPRLARKRRNTSTSNGYCPAFEEFWKAYPRREGKKPAFAAWKTAGGRVKSQQGVSSETAAAYLLDRAIAYAASPRGSWPLDKIPHPATWLNQARYDDDPAAWQAEYNAQPVLASRNAAVLASVLEDLRKEDPDANAE